MEAVRHGDVGAVAEAVKRAVMNKRSDVIIFSSTAIALYGYDQGMMSLINTNYDYLATMGIGEASPLVAVLVSVYYLGCAAGSVLASNLADVRGRKPGIFFCLALSVVGNLVMFVAGLGYRTGAFWVMLAGRVILGLGVGGIDSLIPVYSSELNDEGHRGRAMAQEFQANILGLNIAFGLNLAVTRGLGKLNQWAWRTPIIFMQIFPLFLVLIFHRLPESPRWLLARGREDDARVALGEIFEDDDVEREFDVLKQASKEESSKPVHYRDMLIVAHSQYHPTIIGPIMGQVNQALTGYGCVSVYGPQVLELLGFSVLESENLTQVNFIFYAAMMTFAWLLIDVYGRRKLMLWGSAAITFSFLLLALFGGLIMSGHVDVPQLSLAIPGVVALFIATAAFGIGWLPEPWLIPTEIYPSAARAKGAAISVIVWGFANFSVTFLSPILFNNFRYWIFVIFGITNTIAGLWTWIFSPETGGRTFEQNEQFFIDAKQAGTWQVHKIDKGAFLHMPRQRKGQADDESTPLLR